MATSTITLYRTNCMKPEKNWIFDDMDKFLAKFNYSSGGIQYSPKVIADFQLIRPEIKTSIKINLGQNNVFINESNSKWDYLKIVESSSTYYYFIIKMNQISQNTIEFELKMDVLNTFKFGSSKTTNNYSLSSKSLIKREHKDRFKIDGVIYNNQSLTAETSQERTDFFDGNWNDPFTSTPIFSINRDELLNFVINNGTIGMSLHQIDPVETGINLVLSNGTIKSCYGIRFTYLQVRLLDKNNNITETISWNDITTWFGIQGNYQGTAPFTKYESHTGDYDLFFFGGYPLSQKYTMKKYIDSHRIVDIYQEGLDVVLFKNLTETDLLDDDKYFNWTMFYISNNAVVSNPNDTAATYVNPVKLNFVKDSDIAVSSSVAKRVTISPQYKFIKKYSNNREYLLLYITEMSAASYIELPDGTQITKSDITTEDPANVGIAFSIINDTDTSFASIFYFKNDVFNKRGTEIATNIPYFIAYDIDRMLENYGLSFNNAHEHVNSVHIGSAATSESGTITSWNSLDLTNAKLIKAIALPYSPIDWIVGQSGISIPDGYSLNTDFNSLEISATQKVDLSRQIKFEDVNPFSVLNKPIGYETLFYNTPRNIEWESKLFHSDFYLPKFVYDSFTFPFYLEDLDVDNYKSQYAFSSFIITYAVSKNMLSKMMFKFEQYICNRERQDYYNVLVIDRNNERALYTNAYINYIRSGGYSYDTKKANSQNALNALMTYFAVAGSIASFAAAPATGGVSVGAGIGLATGAISSVVRTLHTAQEQDKAVHQKINQMQLQSMSVSAEEDIDLFTMITGNKAKLVLYEPSEIMKNALWDLFYYCGYATHEQKIPNVTTRCNFNFVQAEIVYDGYQFSDEIANLIKEKWNEGITFFHLMPNNDYDIDYQYENFETFLLEE